MTPEERKARRDRRKVRNYLATHQSPVTSHDSLASGVRYLAGTRTCDVSTTRQQDVTR